MKIKIIIATIITTIVGLCSLMIINCETILAAPPFEEYETFNYPDNSIPAPGWIQVSHECTSDGCEEIGNVINSDNTYANWTVINGRYQLHITPHQELTFVRTFPENWPEELNNYEVIFDMFTLGSINYDRNFVFRYVDPHQWYGLHFYGSSIFIEKQLFNPITKENKGKPLKKITYNFQPNTSYTFKIRVNQNQIDLFEVKENTTNILASIIDNDSPILSGKAGPQSGSWQYSSGDVWFDNIKITNIETPTPTTTSTPIPTPTLTPTPTPTPPPTKVILAPGMGASWNADAILNCKLNNYSGNWTMAPFAEDIYQPLISSLQDNGFNVYPFYYDWRKNIPSHNQEIDNLLNNLQLLENEKINFVGHSMGGLVGGAYIENNNDNKIYKYISAGSPHQGTALAYPAWYGGQIWNNSLVTKIAATLLIKRCGINHKNDMETLRSIAPSFQDLLPTYTFLRDRNGQLKGVDTNKWLLESNFPSQTNTIIATLSGKGFETLENIKVKEPNKKEKKEGIWEEGKPAGKETTYQGDGTVLSKSAKVDGAQNFEINQNHGGLIYSQEGIQTIINFLKGEANTTGLTSTANEEPNSALVIIAHPATFLTIDTKGKIKKDKNNVAAYLNPKSGKYKIGILPLSSESTLLVGQFLKNGDYSWKEYKIKGKLPLVKTINFQEEIIINNPLQ